MSERNSEAEAASGSTPKDSFVGAAGAALAAATATAAAAAAPQAASDLGAAACVDEGEAQAAPSVSEAPSRFTSAARPPGGVASAAVPQPQPRARPEPRRNSVPRILAYQASGGGGGRSGSGGDGRASALIVAHSTSGRRGGGGGKVVPLPPGITLNRAASSNPPSGGSSAGPDDGIIVMSGNGKVEIEWNDALEELMCQEAEKCSGLSWLHSRSETYYSKSNNALQMLMMVLSAVTGATSVGTTALFPQGEKTATVILGCVSIVVTILGLIDSRFAFGKRAEGHRLGAVQYAQIHRMIHIEMSLPRHQRMVPKQLLRYVKDDLKRLMESLPRVPEVIIQRYRDEIIPRAAGVSHPDVTNGVHRVEAYGANRTQPASSASDEGPPPVILPVRGGGSDREYEADLPCRGSPPRSA